MIFHVTSIIIDWLAHTTKVNHPLGCIKKILKIETGMFKNKGGCMRGELARECSTNFSQFSSVQIKRYNQIWSKDTNG